MFALIIKFFYDFNNVGRYDKSTFLIFRKGFSYRQGGIISILYIGSFKELVKDDKQFF